MTRTRLLTAGLALVQHRPAHRLRRRPGSTPASPPRSATTTISLVRGRRRHRDVLRRAGGDPARTAAQVGRQRAYVTRPGRRHRSCSARPPSSSPTPRASRRPRRTTRRSGRLEQHRRPDDGQQQAVRRRQARHPYVAGASSCYGRQEQVGSRAEGRGDGRPRGSSRPWLADHDVRARPALRRRDRGRRGRDRPTPASPSGVSDVAKTAGAAEPDSDVRRRACRRPSAAAADPRWSRCDRSEPTTVVEVRAERASKPPTRPPERRCSSSSR